MQYRPFGKTGFDVSALGFGTMRLPVTGGDPANIDRRETIRMIRHAIDNGVNYADSAYAYHNGQSAVVLGEALRDGYRGRVRIATKLPTWLVQKEEDVEELLDTQLKRLQQEHIDFYLVHNLNSALWPIARDCDVLPALERARDKGKIGHIGFSFHDSFDLFQEIVDASALFEVADAMPGWKADVASFFDPSGPYNPVSYTHLRAHETVLDLVCRLLLEKKKQNRQITEV